MNEANAPVLCLLWGKVKVATEVENSAKGKGNEASLPPESYKIPTADELSWVKDTFLKVAKKIPSNVFQL